MIVEKNRIIELANKIKVLIVNDCVYENNNYYMGVVLDDKEELTNKIIILEKRIVNEETYVKIICDQELVRKLAILLSPVKE